MNLHGEQVLRQLASVYPQLYLTSGEAGAEACRRVVRLGEDAPSHTLTHFRHSPLDTLCQEQTPAGSVTTVTLGDRADFELFLQIMAHRCMPTAIPRTQGAAILDGVINWSRIRAHRDEYLRSGGNPAGWGAEFKRFTAVAGNYRDALIVLSVGPYSAIPAEAAGEGEAEWLEHSHTIRKYHECTHFVCRRLFPDKVDAVWDELVADAVGLYAAYGRFDPALEERFLGISGGHYTGGRLENYVADGLDRSEQLETLAQKVHQTLLHLNRVIAAREQMDPLAPAIQFEAEKVFWDIIPENTENTL